jgi:hypothetical protein
MEFQPKAASKSTRRAPSPIHQPGVPSARILLDDNMLIIMSDSAERYKEIRSHPGNPGSVLRG